MYNNHHFIVYKKAKTFIKMLLMHYRQFDHLMARLIFYYITEYEIRDKNQLKTSRGNIRCFNMEHNITD